MTHKDLRVRSDLPVGGLGKGGRPLWLSTTYEGGETEVAPPW